jgi:hypothetical protein
MNIFARRVNKQALSNPSNRDAMVQLIEPVSSQIASPIERAAIENLKQQSPLSLDQLVQRVAAQLYRDELRHGAAAVDIGLLGSEIFVPEVMGEIQARNGSLWRIEKYP